MNRLSNENLLNWDRPETSVLRVVDLRYWNIWLYSKHNNHYFYFQSMNPIPTHSAHPDLEIRYSSWFEVNQFSHSPSTHHILKLPQNTTTNSLPHPTSFLSNYELISFHFLPINISCKTLWKFNKGKLRTVSVSISNIKKSLPWDSGKRRVFSSLTSSVALKNFGSVCPITNFQPRDYFKKKIEINEGWDKISSYVKWSCYERNQATSYISFSHTCKGEQASVLLI